MTVDDITNKIIAVIGAQNDPVLAGSDTAAVAPRRGGFAAPYPFDPACLAQRTEESRNSHLYFQTTTGGNR
jgi:hypothetical protein